jgi:hypothetical protein
VTTTGPADYPIDMIYIASIFHFFASECASSPHKVFTLFFSMKVAESRKIVSVSGIIVSGIIDFKDILV